MRKSKKPTKNTLNVNQIEQTLKSMGTFDEKNNVNDDDLQREIAENGEKNVI